ncbi:hypothetical protein F4805DRAFT_36886 [Annulohypoxylon moriforme]|nr:hypothetical protein F4805DRAFT_36886 [Annulohypoxylon moriforme]
MAALPPIHQPTIHQPITFLHNQMGTHGPALLPTQPHQIPNPYHNTATCNEVVVCVACGNICRPTVRSAINSDYPRVHHHWTHPALIKAKPGFLKWCSQPWTDRSYRREDSELFDFYIVEQFVGGPSGFWNRTVGQMEINTRDDEMFLPIHIPCLELALEFCRYQSRFDINFRDVSDRPTSGEPSSIAHLYETWMKRAWMSGSRLDGRPTKPIMEPHYYYGAFVHHDLLEYTRAERHRRLLKSDTLLVQESDPSVDMLSTARAVMRGAVRIDAKVTDDRECNPGVVELRARLAAAPPEIRNLIEEAMEPFDDLGLGELYCTRVYPPEWWMNKLIHGGLIPWLHDLTINCVRKALEEPNGPGLSVDQVDWELLCRHLGQLNPFDPDTGILQCPRLKNRYRIWCLLGNTRLAHTVHKRGEPSSYFLRNALRNLSM